MTGSAPFFVTATAAGANGSRGTKRAAEDEEHNETKVRLEALTVRKGELIPLGEIRDALMDQMLDPNSTCLKNLVVLICEDVPGLLEREEDEVYDPLVPYLAPSIPFLQETNNEAGWYQFHTKLADGDGIPRCDSTLLRIPVSQRDLEKHKKAAKKAVKMKIKKFKKARSEEAAVDAEFYVLSPEDLRYHLPNIPFDELEGSGYVKTMPRGDADNKSSEPLLLAIDCEMCRTTKGVELTRVTLVDTNEKVLLDEYVRPKNPIVDYCTQYSGITQDIMESCENRLEEIQKRVLELLPAEAILVGHSIENDLQALKIIHERIIDTTVLYPHPKGPPFRSALRFLASTYLKKNIQGAADGHCSVEDAVSTLQLVHLKIKRGPTFPSIEHELRQKKVINELCSAKKSVLIVDNQRSCRALVAGTACTVSCDSNDKVAHTVVNQLTTGFPPHFTWARLRGATREEIWTHVEKIKASLPAKCAGLLVVMTAEVDALRDMHKLRTTRSDPRCSIMWDKESQAKLDSIARRAQKGLAHIFLQ